MSFVNSIATTRGGSHVNHVSDQLVQMYLDHLAKKHKGLKLKPFQVRSVLLHGLLLCMVVRHARNGGMTCEGLTLKP